MACAKSNPENTLVGIILDVSGSMRENYEKSDTNTNTINNDWIKSIFYTIDSLIMEDLDGNHRIFVIGVGSIYNETFDLLNTIKPIQLHQELMMEEKENIIRGIMYVLENNGAPFVSAWASIETVSSAIDSHTAAVFLTQLASDAKFVESVISFLPSICKEGSLNSVASGTLKFIRKKPASEDDVLDVVKKVKEILIAPVQPHTVMDLKEARNILNGKIDLKNEAIDKERINMLKETAKPFIYGTTPLIQALREAVDLMSKEKYDNDKKLLFVLSDGLPTDGKINDAPLMKLRQKDINVVGCLITKNSLTDPLHLYSKEDDNWGEDVKFMFRLSSTISTEKLPRSIFVKRNWTVDTDSNETKLFVQVNNCSLMKDVCKFAKDVVCSHEALSDVLASVSLDIYINQENKSFLPRKQIGSTCYAFAIGAVIHLSTLRIIGRENGYPEFSAIKDELIASFGTNGANTKKVLDFFCPKYRLRCQEVNLKEAKKAVVEKRPVIAIFSLLDADKENGVYPDSEWARFYKFFNNSLGRLKPLTKKDLEFENQQSLLRPVGHAVVLTSFNSESLHFMNSWGTEWGDKGFFRVAYGAIDFNFYDVFWYQSDLTKSELSAYEKSGSERASQLMTRLNGLKSQTYQCPICLKWSQVSDFSGNLHSVKCPVCRQIFKANDTGNILALNIYLTALI